MINWDPREVTTPRLDALATALEPLALGDSLRFPSGVAVTSRGEGRFDVEGGSPNALRNVELTSAATFALDTDVQSGNATALGGSTRFPNLRAYERGSRSWAMPRVEAQRCLTQ
jgi:hypothetical protein